MRIKFLAPLAAVAMAAACGTDTGPGTGQLQVRLADASCSNIASAEIWVSRTYLIGGADSTGPHFVVSDTAQHYDLLNLQDGVTAILGTTTIPTGSYEQLRLVVDSARITLGGGLTFVGGATTMELTTPSAMQTGIK